MSSFLQSPKSCMCHRRHQRQSRRPSRTFRCSRDRDDPIGQSVTLTRGVHSADTLKPSNKTSNMSAKSTPSDTVDPIEIIRFTAAPTCISPNPRSDPTTNSSGVQHETHHPSRLRASLKAPQTQLLVGLHHRQLNPHQFQNQTDFHGCHQGSSKTNRP